MPLRKAFSGALIFFFAITLNAAEEPPPVIYGDVAVETNLFGTSFKVDSEWSQIRLNQYLLATAEKGTVFEVYSPLLGGDSETLHVTQGKVLLINQQNNLAANIPLGSRLTYDAIRSKQTSELAQLSEAQAISASAQLDDAHSRWERQEERQNFLLSDYVMSRQQEYLSSLKINVTDVNRALGSLIRQMLVR